MNLPRYQYFATNDYLEYYFYSEGPQGTIKKVVRFRKINDSPLVFNLGFGDQDLNTQEISDTVVSDNQDRETVLATIANIIVHFSKQRGNCLIYGEGSTPSRTRLYQIGISKLFDDIDKDFEIFGMIGFEIHEFKRDVNYDAFLVRRR